MDLEVRAFYSGLSILLSKCKEDLQDSILGFEVKFIQLVSTSRMLLPPNPLVVITGILTTLKVLYTF